MKLVKIIKDYIRGFDYDSNTEMVHGYTIESIQIKSGINRDLSIIVSFFFLQYFGLELKII